MGMSILIQGDSTLARDCYLVRYWSDSIQIIGASIIGYLPDGQLAKPVIWFSLRRTIISREPYTEAYTLTKYYY